MTPILAAGLAAVTTERDPTLLAVLVAGIVGGLVLLARGFAGYAAAGRIGGTSASRISSIAVGEVLVTGTAEPIELTLVSPLQSALCVYYRSRVGGSARSDGDTFREERAVGFRVRDATGAVRVFPGNARFDVPDRFDERSGALDGAPPGLALRDGSAFGPGTNRQAQIDALLTVHRTAGTVEASPLAAVTVGSGGTMLSGGPIAVARGGRRFREARIEPGDVVTVLGTVVPFGEIADPTAANLLDGSAVATDDPEIAADLAAARAAGTLAGSAADAWGNAAIEGFGIGRPVRPPHLDPAATAPPPPDPAIAARAREAFDIAPDALVLAGRRDAPLLVSLGPPATVETRQQGRFVLGLLGAIVSIASALALAVIVTGGGP